MRYIDKYNNGNQLKIDNTLRNGFMMSRIVDLERVRILLFKWKRGEKSTKYLNLEVGWFLIGMFVMINMNTC